MFVWIDNINDVHQLLDQSKLPVAVRHVFGNLLNILFRAARPSHHLLNFRRIHKYPYPTRSHLDLPDFNTDKLEVEPGR